MTIETYKMITCDICGSVDYYPTTSQKVARDIARTRAGWKYIKGKDICKECLKNLKQESEK